MADRYSKPEISYVDWDGEFLRIRVDDRHNLPFYLEISIPKNDLERLFRKSDSTSPPLLTQSSEARSASED